ncbi:MAG: response regulator [Acidobacteria bacterium]|nr:response regulator [Acidobacteriota bacterium]
MPLPTARILIIDDDPNSSELVGLMLQYSGVACESTCVQTPEEGLRLATAQRFDLYLLDYRLPGMSGAEVCRAIRRIDANTPVMFFTAAVYERDRREAMQAGANAYLVKPDDLKKLTETVKCLIGGSKLTAAQGVPLTAYQSGVST